MGAERLKQNANFSGEIKTQASQLKTGNFSQERLSVCEMEITLPSFLYFLVSSGQRLLVRMNLYSPCYTDLFV